VRRTKVETDKMEKNILIAILVLSASYCGKRAHQKKCMVSGPGIILKSTASFCFESKWFISVSM